MKPSNPHRKSQALRRFKPTRKPAGIFGSSVAMLDASLLVLGFFLAVSPLVLQPGVNINLPPAPFTGGARFDAMVLSIPRGGAFYFNDERLSSSKLLSALQTAAIQHPQSALIIEADESIPYGLIIQAWNTALSAGIKEVSMATRIAATEEDLRP